MHAMAFALGRHPVVIAALLALACSGTAVAQTRLYLLTQGSWCGGSRCPPARLIEIDVEGRRVAADMPVPGVMPEIGPAVTPDGRFLLWSGIEYLVWDYTYSSVVLFDLARHHETVAFAGDGSSAIVPFSVHPSQMRAFMQLSLGGPVAVVEPGGVRVMRGPACEIPSLEGTSGDGRRLSFRCDNPVRMTVVDSSDGRLLGTVPHGAIAHALDDAGSTMFAVNQDLPQQPAVYRRFDVNSGAVQAERQAPPFEFLGALWQHDPRAGHLYSEDAAGIVVLDASTLAEIGRIDRPSPFHAPRIALDPDRPHAYVAWSGRIAGRHGVRVSLVNTGTFATIGWLDIAVDSAVLGITIGPRPPRLSNLQVGIVGSLATLTWTIAASRSIATEQIVEVGFAPGETVARLPVAAGATSLTVPGVPPGRYFVRVRSVNGTGIGAPSNEVVVDVR
jgi:hypothetical protein